MAKQMICSNCGLQGKPKTITKGNLLIEIVLWLCLIIPGLIYSLWRQFSKYKACPSCDATNMVPLDSPRGKKLTNEFK